ncbi:hypothetical protein GCM10028801_11920 [Nocardioides maradonensis]
MSDFLALLGSRATVPGEVRSEWGIAEYVAGLDKLDQLPGLDQLPETPDLGRLDPARLDALLRAFARPPSAELNRARLASLTGIPPTTLPPYVAALAQRGVVRMVPGTRSVVAKRAVARPRVVFADAGLARELGGASPAELAQMSGRWRLGPLLYGLVAVALQDQGLRVTHLRERNGLKVDLLVELPDETVYGLEVRTAAGVRPHQFAALEALANRAGQRFRGGVVLNTAPVGHEHAHRLWSLPISSVWEAEG